MFLTKTLFCLSKILAHQTRECRYYGEYQIHILGRSSTRNLDLLPPNEIFSHFLEYSRERLLLYYIHISSSYYAKAQLVGGMIFGTNMLEESYLLVCILRLRQKKDMYTHTRIIFMLVCVSIHPEFLLG